MDKNVIDSVIRDIPENIDGIERQKLIGDNLSRLSAGDRSGMREIIESALRKMLDLNASDLDFGGLGCEGKIWYRVEGVKKPFDGIGRFDLLQSDVLCQNLLRDSQRAYLYRNRNVDFSYQIGNNGDRLRYRADIYFEMDNLALNTRFVPNAIRPLKELGLHPKVLKRLSLITENQGLVLITGITGSGKSSTLDSIIDANNRTANGHIMIISSPIETVHRSNKCIIRQREVGKDTHSFKTGAIEALRQDPDIIVIGEMRDPETVTTALEITDSGHKVFSTLHTASAVESLDRIIGESPSIEQERIRNRLADTLKCVISQKLIPDYCGRRLLAKEVLVMTPSIKAAIKNNNTDEIYQMINEGAAEGMHTMEQDLLKLVREESISISDAENFANNKQRMKELLGLK